jgi:hypothetical protein
LSALVSAKSAVYAPAVFSGHGVILALDLAVGILQKTIAGGCPVGEEFGVA